MLNLSGPRTARFVFFLLLVLPLVLPPRGAEARPAGVAEDDPRAEGSDFARRRAAAFEEMYRDDSGAVDPHFRLRQARFNLARAATRRPLGALRTNFVSLGPTNLAGRVSSLAVHPGDPRIVYRGTAGGGLWKTTDGGTSWKPLTDDIGDLSVGAVSLAPSDPETVYLGTGEGANTIDAIDGIGFLRSTDGGRSWTLPATVVARRFYAISVHPANANELVAATSSGLLFSEDGGNSFAPSLSTFYATALVRDPSNAPVLVAATHYGPGTKTGAIHRSTDGGRSWTKVAAAGTAPFDANIGRISLALAPSSPTLIFALAAAANGSSRPECTTSRVDQYGLFRSTDTGATWAFVSNPVTGSCGSYQSILGGQGWYANTLIVDPTNANVLYAGGLDTWKSTDGGSKWSTASYWYGEPGTPQYVHADIHAMAWVGATLWIGNDGGVERTSDGGSSFSSLNTGIVTRQFYSVAVTGANRAIVIAGAQDNGTNLRTAGTLFTEVYGGDGMGVAASPTSASDLYGSLYDGIIVRSTNGGSSFRRSTPSSLYASTEVLPFITPLTMDPNDPSILYTGSNLLYRTTDAGGTWKRVSTTDLGDGGSGRYLTKIAVARSDSNSILTATGNGKVKRSTDGGLTFGPALTGGLPSSRYASHVEFDPRTSRTIYVAYAGSASGDRLFKSVDDGVTFRPITAGLPPFALHVVRVDPLDSNVLYAGTDVGLYRSIDAGASWERFGSGMPAASVWDIALLPDGSMMRVATHGRGMWELQNPSEHVAVTGSGNGAVPGTPVRR